MEGRPYFRMEGLEMKGHEYLELLRPYFEEFQEKLIRMWEQMKKVIEDYEREDFEPDPLFDCYALLPLPMKSQVMMNKPTNIRARTSC
jgi:hypothetical protein